MLIIIDMQREYSASGFIVPAVCNQIVKAKNRKEQIVLVEYRCFGCRRRKDCFYKNEFNTSTKCETHDAILELLREYPKLIRVQKNADDGSDELVKAVSKFPTNVNVCGVNTSACVKATVEGLIEKLPKINFTLLLDACNDDVGGQKDSALRWTTKYQNTARKNGLTLSQK